MQLTQEVSAAMVEPGLHMGRLAVGSGNPTIYIVQDLLGEGRNDSYKHIDLPEEITYHRSLNIRYEAEKIKMFLDKFLETVSSLIPISQQKDISGATLNFYAAEGTQPETIQLASSYLVHAIYMDDIDNLSVSVR